jgi:hypothetical protein
LEALLAVCLGVGLAAACGFRVFLPPLALGIAIRLGLPATDAAPEWLGSWIAIGAFAAASIVEVVAYYVPWLDNLLDAVASPLAVVAGVLLTAGVARELHPAAQWTLAIVAGGGAAATTQTVTVMVRALSSTVTGGLANFMVATAEGALSLLFIFAALLFAPIAILLLGAAVYALVRLWRRRRAARATAPA